MLKMDKKTDEKEEKHQSRRSANCEETFLKYVCKTLFSVFSPFLSIQKDLFLEN